MEIEPIYLFDNKKELIDIIPVEQLMDNSQDWTLNGLIKSSVTGVYSKVVESAHYYGTRDIDEPDVFWQYKIISYTKQDNLFNFEGIYVLFDDLSGRGIVKDKRPNKAHTTEVLGYILEGTGWQIGNVYSSKKATSNHYYISKLEAFWDFIEKWRVEFKPRMTYSGGKVTGKYIDIYDRVSDDFGKWYEYGDSLLSVEAEEMRENVFTAFVGRGKGEEVGDGFGRKIGFKDVVWTTGAGKPVDKPINQDYVEIPWATALYGYEDGTPRMTIVDFPDIEDPSELLDATYEYALTECRPKVQFKSNVLETERADVGEVVTIIRDDIGIRYKTRIFNLKRNFLNRKVKTIQFGEQLVQSTSQTAKKTATAIKKQEEQTLNWLLALREAITDSYFNEDGYNYELSAGNEYGWPGGYYSFNRPIDQDPSKVVYVGAGKVLLANSKNPDGSWIWRTAMDGDGVIADEINAGTLTGLRFVNNFLNGTTPGQLVIDGDIKMTAGKIGFELNEERVLFEDATNKTTLGHDGLKFYRNDELIGEIKIEYFSSTGQTAVTLSNAKKGTNGIRINQNRIEVTERNQGANDLDIFVIPSGEGKILVSDPTKFSWKGVRALDYEFPKRSRIYEAPDGGLEVQANATYTLRQGGGTYAFNVDASRMKLQRDLDMSGNKVTNTSDIRLKKNIEDATIDPLKQVNKMKFITAEWDKTNPFNHDKPDERFFGQVAQYAPTIMQVKNGIKDHYLSIDKGVQSDLNSMAIQELDKKTQRIETLEQELADLKTLLKEKGVI